MKVILAVLADIIPDYVRCVTEIDAMVDMETFEILDKGPEEKFLSTYYSFQFLYKNIQKWKSDIDFFKDDILGTDYKEDNVVLMIVHPDFEDEVAELLERLSLIEKIELGGLYFVEESSQKDTRCFFSFPLIPKKTFKNN